MTLNAAISSGRKIRLGSSGGYVDARTFLSRGLTVDQFNSTAYETEPVVSATIPNNIFMEAWDAAIGSRKQIAHAAQSGFFEDVKSQLASRGVVVS